MEVVLATGNPGKLKELKEIALDVAGNSKAVSELQLLLAPEGFNPDETGTTYEENAILKAREAGKLTGKISVADDSGIEVDALDGRPGLHSARYAPGNDANRRQKLLDELVGVPEGKRQARFICHMAVWSPDTNDIIYTVRGVWEGRIGFEERGTEGFGFDPIFYLPDIDTTAAELPAKEKNIHSHRGQAWRQVLAFMEKTFMPK